MKRKRRGSLLMSLGALLLAGAIGLTIFNQAEEAGSNAFTVQVRQILAQDVIAPVIGTDADIAALSEDRPTVMQSVKVDGGYYIGIVDIPALELSLPIQETLSPALLKNAPCRYTGSFFDDDMIVAGHNFKRQFGLLAQLQGGELVTFTDVDGNVYSYEVESIETLDGSDVEGMMEGDWDLTLFTCTIGGKSRVTVRCIRSEIL